MRTLFAVVFVLLFVIPAHADVVDFSQVSACGQTTIAALIGTTCSIGDKAFTFISYDGNDGDGNGSATPVDGALLTFTPNATDPYNLSFTIGGAGMTAAATVPTPYDPSQNGELFLTISAAPGSLFLSSYDITLNGATAFSGGQEAPNYFPNSSVFGSMYLSSHNCTATTILAAGPAGPLNIYESCGNAPVAQESGYLGWGASAHDVPAAASMDSVTFNFHQDDVQQVPELSSLALLPLGLVGIGIAGRLRKRMGEGCRDAIDRSAPGRG